MIMPDRVVLGIDTSTVVSVGLAVDGLAVASATGNDRMAHVEQLSVLVRQATGAAGLALSELSQIVVGLGPGPFTGLRVGIVTAQVLSVTLGATLHGVCSLDVVAAQYADQHYVDQPNADQRDFDSDFVVATDARRSEVYWARYSANGIRVEGPAVNRPLDVPRLPTIGPGADHYPGGLEAVAGPRTLSPSVLVTSGPNLPDAGPHPLYLRRPDAAEPGRRKPVLLHRGRR
jgi:tRNA threonylcarbamoyl adenosine modification protein YeaZ